MSGLAVLNPATGETLAETGNGGAAEVERAVQAARAARRDWSPRPPFERAAVLLTLADVVAAGRDPRGTTIGEIAEPPNWTIDPEVPLDEAFQRLEQWDAERVPVVDDGSLVGVLSRSVLQRRLAEDEPPSELDVLEL